MKPHLCFTGIRRFVSAMLLGILSLSLAGCGEAVSPEILAWRKKYLVETVISGEQTIAKVREKLKSGELGADSEFVVRVRINAGDLPPWGSDTASFVVTEAIGHDGDESHDPHNCPFCSRDIQNNIAQVHFSDDDGKLIQIDSRNLFDLTQHQLIVVKGTGQIDDTDTLVIHADQMYVTRK